MPLFTTTLLLFITLAALAFTLRTRAKFRKSQQQRVENDKMKLAAQICEASSRNAFGLTLDYSLVSLQTLNDAITQHWTNAESPSPFQNNALLVLSAYTGEIFVREFGAEWREVQGPSSVPYLFFSDVDLKASPFDLVEQKLANPQGIDLYHAAQSLIDELNRHAQSLISPNEQSGQ